MLPRGRLFASWLHSPVTVVAERDGKRCNAAGALSVLVAVPAFSRGLTEHDQAEDVLSWHGAVGAAVDAHGAVVAHDEIVIRAAGDQLLLGLGVSEGEG